MDTSPTTPSAKEFIRGKTYEFIPPITVECWAAAGQDRSKKRLTFTTALSLGFNDLENAYLFSGIPKGFRVQLFYFRLGWKEKVPFEEVTQQAP